MCGVPSLVSYLLHWSFFRLGDEQLALLIAFSATCVVFCTIDHIRVFDSETATYAQR